jgi:hypothetical protein
MVPEHLRFGGGTGESVIHPLVALCLLISIVLIMTLPRGKAIVPFLAAFFTIPLAQVVVLAGFHFTVARILILAGLIRRATYRGSSSRGEYPGGFNGVDLAVVLWSLCTLVTFCLQFVEMQAWVNGLGTLLETLGGYMVVRFLIPDGKAMRRTIKTLVVICVIQGVCMINEQITSVNVFGLLGGIPLAACVREGRIRSAGSLGALTAGPFAGVLIPLFFWLWTERKSRMAACAGLAAATVMVITSNSSTSWMAFGASLVGLAFWRLRKRMRQIRWGLLFTLVGLHLYMKAPVWALISRIDLTGSSSSYQRYILMDMTIRHFSDWWLLGTTDYVNWGWDSYDLCNQFVAVALTGGLLTLIFYVVILKRSFGAIGTARKMVNGDRRQEWLLWCLGSDLFATVVTHFGINYVGQLLMSLYALFAFICVATDEARRAKVKSVEAPGEDQFVYARDAEEAYLPLAGSM